MFLHKIAPLRMNAFHVPTTTVFLEDLCRASTVCAARIVVAGTFRLKEGGQNLKGGGGSSTVYRFGENPAR